MLAWVFETKYGSALLKSTGPTGDSTGSYGTGSASWVSVVCALGCRVKFCPNGLAKRNRP